MKKHTITRRNLFTKLAALIAGGTPLAAAAKLDTNKIEIPEDGEAIKPRPRTVQSDLQTIEICFPEPDPNEPFTDEKRDYYLQVGQALLSRGMSYQSQAMWGGVEIRIETRK